MMKTLLLSAAALATATLRAADSPAQVFQIHCSACHAVDTMVVGPSLVEIAGIYRNDPDGFVKWCIAPQHKRPGVIEMPSMAHLGEPVLRQLHAHVLSAAAGKTEQKAAGGDPFAVPRAQVRRPQVQRIFLPDASPAAIAVALPGDLSFCFDATECRLRYVWKGGFIDGFSYWKGNGSELAKLDGQVVYREPAFPLVREPGGKDQPPDFLGYRVAKDGLPTFRYRRDGITWTETIRPLSDGSGIERHFTTEGTDRLTLAAPAAATLSSSTGGTVLSGEQAKSFTLTLRWK
jgi:cytochrome c551/c552